jgi:hypothetical protein
LPGRRVVEALVGFSLRATPTSRKDLSPRALFGSGDWLSGMIPGMGREWIRCALFPDREPGQCLDELDEAKFVRWHEPKNSEGIDDLPDQTGADQLALDWASTPTKPLL